MSLDFGSLFSKKMPRLVGLDLSTTGVHLVELSEAEGLIKLERYATELLPRGAIVDGNIENIEQVSEAVRRVWEKSGSRAKHVSMGIPPSSVITKKIVLPKGLSEEEMEFQVESEASQYIPFALDEVRLDFDIVGPSPDSAGEVEVLLAASRKEKIEDRVAVMELAGLKPMVLDIESYAARVAIDRVVALLPRAGQGQIIGLFQIGAQMAHISVLLDGELVYEREQPFGGNQLTQDIVRTYGLSHEEAELKKKTGDLPDGYRADVLDPFLESVAGEVVRAIQYFYNATPYTRLDQLFLAGGAAITLGLAGVIERQARVPVSIVNPFKGMQLASNIREKQLRNEAPTYLVACGLAMRRFD